MLRAILLSVFVLFCHRLPPALADESEIVRVKLHIDEYGEGSVSISRTKEPLPRATGENVTLKSMPKAKATKVTDHVFRIEHDFADADSLKQISSTSEHVEKWTEAKGLMFTPGKTQWFGDRNAALFHYAYFSRLPITLTCDFARAGGGEIIIKFDETQRNFGHAQLRLKVNARNFEGGNAVQMRWNEFKDGKFTGKGKTLFDKSNQTFKNKFEEKFRLPLPNVEIKNRFEIQIYAMDTAAPTLLRRLAVEGRFIPRFGMAIAEQGESVFVKEVMANTVAEKAGVKDGDVILSINGEKPTTQSDALEKLASIAFNGRVDLEVQRRNEKKTLTLHAN